MAVLPHIPGYKAERLLGEGGIPGHTGEFKSQSRDQNFGPISFEK